MPILRSSSGAAADARCLDDRLGVAVRLERPVRALDREAGQRGEVVAAGEDAQVETHYEDCFACRMTGSLSFAALSGYSFVQYRKVLPGATLSHRVLLLGMTGAFAGAGVFRWLV